MVPSPFVARYAGSWFLLSTTRRVSGDWIDTVLTVIHVTAIACRVRESCRAQERLQGT
jgi:hypothetical protein